MNQLTEIQTAPEIQKQPVRKKYRRRFGDRKDGRRLRSLKPYNYISPYIMVERNDSSNMIRDAFETTEVDRYIREKREQGMKSFGIMHVLLAAYVRLVSQKPRINRFINGQKIFARFGIQVNLAVKPEMTEDSVDTVVKMRYERTDTAKEVYEKTCQTIEEALSGENSFDQTAKLLNYIPGLIKKNVVFLLKLLDYFGLLPRAQTDVSPFHGSMFITSMGSLGIPPIYHHLYNFGNVPVFISFGRRRAQNELTDDGTVVKRHYVDYTIVTDERICDGFYYATCLRFMKRILQNPWLLDAPPVNVYEDVE